MVSGVNPVSPVSLSSQDSAVEGKDASYASKSHAVSPQVFRFCSMAWARCVAYSSSKVKLINCGPLQGLM
jgi:hypothetical protein